MGNNKDDYLKKLKRIDRAIWVLVAVAFTITIALTVFICMQLFAPDGYKPTDWVAGTQTEDTVSGGLSVPEESAGSGMTLLSCVILSEDYEEYNIPAEAESAVRLSVTVTPANAVNQVIDWSLSWGEEVRWGEEEQGEIEDYVVVAPDSDGAMTATVYCLGAFGTRINLTASVRGSETISATCPVDYKQKAFAALIVGEAVYLDGDTIDYAELAAEKSVKLVQGNTETYTVELFSDGMWSEKGYATTELTVSESYANALKKLGIDDTACTFAYIDYDEFMHEPNPNPDGLECGIGEETLPVKGILFAGNYQIAATGAEFTEYENALKAHSDDTMLTLSITQEYRKMYSMSGEDFSVAATASFKLTNISVPLTNGISFTENETGIEFGG